MSDYQLIMRPAVPGAHWRTQAAVLMTCNSRSAWPCAYRSCLPLGWRALYELIQPDIVVPGVPYQVILYSAVEMLLSSSAYVWTSGLGDDTRDSKEYLDVELRAHRVWPPASWGELRSACAAKKWELAYAYALTLALSASCLEEGQAYLDYFKTQQGLAR